MTSYSSVRTCPYARYNSSISLSDVDVGVGVQGGGSANKTYLYQETKALLNPESLAKFVGEKIKTIGESRSPSPVPPLVRVGPVPPLIRVGPVPSLVLVGER